MKTRRNQSPTVVSQVETLLARRPMSLASVLILLPESHQKTVEVAVWHLEQHNALAYKGSQLHLTPAKDNRKYTIPLRAQEQGPRAPRRV